MSRFILCFVFFWACSYSLYAQKDTLKVRGFANIQGIVQTGNLNQIGGNAIGNLTFFNSKFSTRLSLSYNFVRFDGFTVSNDSWNYAIFKLKPSKKAYPVLMPYYGFAKTFGIEQSHMLGAGAGVNIIKKSPLSFLEFNLTAGHLSFTFTNATPISTFALNTFIHGNTQIIQKKIGLNWQVHAFTSITDNTFGFQNTLRFSIPITPSWSLTLSQNAIYNEKVDLDKETLNTLTLLGIAFKK